MAAEGFLLDTNAISETRKRRPHPGALAVLRSFPYESLHLSVLTIDELRRWDAVRSRSNPDPNRRYSAWIDQLEVDYEQRILRIDQPIATL